MPEPAKPRDAGPAPTPVALPVPTPVPLSVAIVCKSNEATIGRVLGSVAGLASEIVALDSGSTDRTIPLLEAAGAIVHRVPWQGHVRTKQRALEACTQRWVLCLDSDEYVDEALARSIREAIGRDDPLIDAYRVNRKVLYRGELLHHAWQPEPRTRLVRRADVPHKIAWGGIDPHDQLQVSSASARLEVLGGTLIHDTIEDIASFLHAQVRLSAVSAQSLSGMGRRTGGLRMLISPLGAAFKQVVLKGAWRDGWRGWCAAGSTAAATLMKHLILLERMHVSGDGPREIPRTEGPRAGEATGAPTIGATQHGIHAPGDFTPGGGANRTKDRRMSEKTEQSDARLDDQSPASENEQSDRAPREPHDAANATNAGEAGEGATGDDQPKKKKKRRRRRRKPADAARADGQPGDETADTANNDDSEASAGEDDEDDAEIAADGLRSDEPIPFEPKDPELFELDRTWEDLGLPPKVRDSLQKAGFQKATRIQAELIPVMLEGKDVLGQAKTGTGKTAAFGLPMLSMIEPGQTGRGLVLAPTRELALQIADALSTLGKHTGLRVVPIYGGQRIQAQVEKLEKGAEIIVGTPGRIQDMVERRHMSLDGVGIAVLDEVDRMLDIGFRDDIRRILGQCPKDRQTVMVSATISKDVEDLARRYMRTPEKIVTSSGSLTVRLVEQHYITVDPWDKKRLLTHVLLHEEPALTVVFCRLKRSVDDVAMLLEKKGIEAHAIHGDMRQNKRDDVMRQLRKGKLAVLVASDLAARGLDVKGVTHVINYDLPEDPEVYVHRIGRTARAGRGGTAWSFVTPEQGKLLTEIEKLTNVEMSRLEYPDFEPRERPENFREPAPGGRPPAKQIDAPPPKNRFGDRKPPKLAEKKPDELSDDEKAKLAAKFPGGIVPSKMPPKKIHGRVRTARSNRAD